MSRLEYITSDGWRLPVKLRRRKGTRHLRLSLNLRKQIVLSLPWHCSERAGLKFMEQNRQWLEGKLASAPKALGLAQWLEQWPWLTAGGIRLHVVWQKGAGSRAGYTIKKEEERVDLQLPPVAEDAVLNKLVRKFAKEVLFARTSELARRHGLHFSRLTVRNQSSRWGSCSSKRAISLNWRLVLIEPAVQDYIILHELAHLSEMNHSKKFWQLLTSYDPKRERHEAVLKALTPKIMRVGLDS